MTAVNHSIDTIGNRVLRIRTQKGFFTKLSSVGIDGLYLIDGLYQYIKYIFTFKGPLHPNSSIVVNMYLTYLNIFAKIRSRYLVSVTRKLVKYR